MSKKKTGTKQERKRSGKTKGDKKANRKRRTWTKRFGFGRCYKFVSHSFWIGSGACLIRLFASFWPCSHADRLLLDASTT
jgi:hypothetical protein